MGVLRSITLSCLLLVSLCLTVYGHSHIPPWVVQRDYYSIPGGYAANGEPLLKSLEEGDIMKKFIHKKLAEKQAEVVVAGGGNVANKYNTVSAQCAQDMKVLDAAKKLPDTYQWAYQYMNADAKDTILPKGFYLGKFYTVGSGDLCHRIKATNVDVYEVGGSTATYGGTSDIDGYDSINFLNTTGNVTYVGKHSFNAHHCKAQWSSQASMVGLSEGWCVPESCDRNDVINLMEDRPFGPLKLSYCGTKPPLKTNVGAIITIVISSLFVALVVTASLVDGISTWYTKMKAEEEDTTTYNFADTSLDNKKQSSATAVDTIQESSAVYQAFVAFSVFRTLPTVLDTGGARAKYGCMNGLRFFAMAWIVCGHIGDIGSIMPANPRTVLTANFIYQFEYKNRFGHQLLNNMNLSVDIFFFLGATLATLSFMKTLKRLETVGHLGRLKAMGLHVFHRYWREELLIVPLLREVAMDTINDVVCVSNGIEILTPLLAAVLMMVPNLWTYTGYGIIFPERVDQFDSCKKSWWPLLLYIQNLYRGPEGDCLGWTWYLANDFQFYLIMPLFAVLLYISPFFGPAFLFLGWLGTTIARSYLISTTLKDEYWELYVKPWARFGPYAIGIAMGHILYRTKASKVKLNVHLMMLGWLVSTLVSVLIIFGTYQRSWEEGCEQWGCIRWSIPEQRAYKILKRDAFALCLAWTIFACINGYGGIVNTFLAWDFFTPLSKLTYAGYLIHPVIHASTLANRQQLFYVQDLTFIYQYLFVLMMTLILSLGFTLVFEVPFLTLEKIMLRSHKK